MPLEVIGAGFGRTGTLSLKVALEELGFVKCHHMREVAGNAEQLDAWNAIALGAEPDWDAVFEGFRASVDWPSCTYWEALLQRYPDSKVILSIRDPDRWYDSVRETIYPATNEMPAWMCWAIPRIRKFVELTTACAWEGTFGGRFLDRAHALEVFRQNSQRVKEVVPPDRLLVFQATDGWEPLCAFLGVPVPEGDYPHVNEAAEIKRMVSVVRALRWAPHGAVALAVLWILL